VCIRDASFIDIMGCCAHRTCLHAARTCRYKSGRWEDTGDLWKFCPETLTGKEVHNTGLHAAHEKIKRLSSGWSGYPPRYRTSHSSLISRMPKGEQSTKSTLYTSKTNNVDVENDHYGKERLAGASEDILHYQWIEIVSGHVLTHPDGFLHLCISFYG
jgi:hypothetical protein